MSIAITAGLTKEQGKKVSDIVDNILKQWGCDEDRRSMIWAAIMTSLEYINEDNGGKQWSVGDHD